MRAKSQVKGAVSIYIITYFLKDYKFFAKFALHFAKNQYL